MNKVFALLALLLTPAFAGAATLLAVSERGGVVVRADSNEIAALARSSLRPEWTARGVANPRILVVSPDERWAAAIDPVSNQLVLADLARRTSRMQALPETAIAARFFEAALFVLSRDARILTRIDLSGGETRTAAVPMGASHMVAGETGVVVYSALTGDVERFDGSSLRARVAGRLPRFASDLESDGQSGFLALPRSGRLAAFALETLALEDDRAAGAVPVDIAVEARGNAASPVRIAIADPSSKRVWRDEGPQSTGEAFGRGFLRGLLGLGLYAPRSAAFPAGVDRMMVNRGRLIAFDTSSGTVYAVDGDRVTRLATGTAWGAFAIAGNDLLVARGPGVERKKLPD